MYTGLTAFRDAPSVSSYEEACAVLERFSKTPKLGRPREEKAWGYHLGANRNHGVTWVRKGNEPKYEDAIAFRLYDTDVVTWFPDNSVEIDNFGTVTTSDFARQFLPGGIYLSHPVERRGETGGHKGIHYRVGERTKTASWDPSYTYSVGEYRLCFGGLVRLRETGDGWRPDEDGLDEIAFPELTDRKAAREMARQYHLRDFEMWLSMAPRHMRIEHDCWDVDDCMNALEKRDFTLASMFLPTSAAVNPFGKQEVKDPLPFIIRNSDQCITLGSITKLKLAMWEREGLLETVTFKTIAAAEFERRMRRVRELRALGCDNDYGPYRW